MTSRTIGPAVKYLVGPRGERGRTGPAGPQGETGDIQGVTSIADFGAVEGSGKSAGVRTANTLAIQTAINTVASFPNTGLAHGGDLYVPPGIWEINDRLTIGGVGDFISGLRLRGGGGRYTSVIAQMDPTKGVLEVTNTTLNTRGVSVEDLTLAAGTIGLECKNEAYNTYRNITFYGQTLYGVYAPQNCLSRFTECWFTDVTGNCLHFLSGVAFFDACTFGEASGGIYVESGTVSLNDCYLFDCRDQLALSTLGSGTAVIQVASGGTLCVDGGVYTPRASGCVTFIFGNNAGAVVINGGRFIMPANITGFIADHQANTYNAPLNCKPGVIASLNASGLSVYREISGTAIKARYRSVIDTCTQYTTVAPTVGADWSDAGQENETALRARVLI